MAKGSTDVAVRSKDEIYELLVHALDRSVDITELYDSEQVQLGLAQGILGTESEDAVFGGASLQAWSELLDVPVELHGVHFNPSNVENGPGVYGVVDVTQLDTGERAMRHVGGYRPVAQLLWLWKRDRFPFKCKLSEVAKAKTGQSAPLGIVRLAAEPS